MGGSCWAGGDQCGHATRGRRASPIDIWGGVTGISRFFSQQSSFSFVRSKTYGVLAPQVTVPWSLTLRLAGLPAWTPAQGKILGHLQGQLWCLWVPVFTGSRRPRTQHSSRFNETRRSELCPWSTTDAVMGVTLSSYHVPDTMPCASELTAAFQKGPEALAVKAGDTGSGWPRRRPLTGIQRQTLLRLHPTLCAPQRQGRGPHRES